ncbi:TonB-like protein [Candidatus Koribacter versatilis Ellin345]|uniref:TonB-like protein n=1 Tax=Koribacter versatilis (strain Ellin345) TaxID=204669 RepID=Q1IPS6_KORVE|nr:TonB family protein [Candidatus Koribacter versatilis]ABF41124.1 TonB-like protein [Candidatus Koribacter versatilis Ellin345]
MNKGKLTFATLALLACLAIPCYAQQTTQQQDDEEEAPPPKPRPAPKDAGFGAPETVAPTPSSHQQQDTTFNAPETAGPNGSRPGERQTNFTTPEMVSPDELPAKRGASETSSSGANPLMGAARARLIQVRNATDIRGKSAQPFRMHAVFSGMSDSALASGGTYTELWLSNTRWRREAVVGQVHVIESRDGNKFYRQIVGREYAPRVLDDLLDALYLTFPVLGVSSFVEADWQQGTVLYAGTSALRISTGLSAGGPSADARAFWLNTDSVLIAAYRAGTVVEYADYDAWNGKQVARHINVKENGVKVAGIWIDQLDTAPAETGSQFALDGATAIPVNDGGYDGPYFVAPHPVHQVSPKDPPAGTGTITITVNLDQHGHVRNAKLKQGINDALDAAALKAATQWEFSPALTKGRPTPSEATVEFTF